MRLVTYIQANEKILLLKLIFRLKEMYDIYGKSFLKAQHKIKFSF